MDIRRHRRPCWLAQLPLYFSLQIEKQNRHQGYIYITVFKLHFLLPSAAHDKFQVFSNKGSGGPGWIGRKTRCACVQLPECLAPYLVWRLILLELHLKMLKCPLAGSASVERWSDILHVMFIQKCVLDPIKGRTEYLYRPLNPFPLVAMEAAHIFVVKSLERGEMWGREMAGGDI